MRVVDQVRDDALETAAIDTHERVTDAVRDLDRWLVHAVTARRRAHRLTDEFDGGQGLHHEGHGAGVTA